MKKRFRILLLSATIFCCFSPAFAQIHLSVTSLLHWPDTAYCNNTDTNIRVAIKNMDLNTTFNGTIYVNIHDSSGSHTTDSGVVSIQPLGTDSSISLNTYSFNSPEYVAGHDVVIVWPIASGAITDSITDTVFVICNSGIPDYKNEKEFALYPDPANDYLYLKSGYSSNEIDYIRMMDIEGKELKRFNSYQAMIPVNHLARGMYFIEIKLKSGESITSKFVKD